MAGTETTKFRVEKEQDFEKCGSPGKGGFTLWLGVA